MALPAASRARWLPLPPLGRAVAASLAAAAAVLAGYLLGSGGDALAVLAAVLGLGLVALAEPQWAVAAVLALGMGHLSDAAFAALDVLPPYKVLIGLLAVLLVLRLAATRGRCLVLTGTLALLLFFLGALGGSALFAAHPDAGLARVEDLAREFAIAFLVANLLTTRAGLHRAVWTLVGVGALLAALSLYQTVSGDVSERFFGLAQARSLHIVGALNRPRASGPFGDPNAYGQYLLVFAALALFRAWDERQLLLRLAGLAALGMILAALVLTFSRGAFVGLALACLVLVALRRPTWKGLLIGIVLCAPLAALLLGMAESRSGRRGRSAAADRRGQGEEEDRPVPDWRPGAARGRAWPRILAAFGNLLVAVAIGGLAVLAVERLGVARLEAPGLASEPAPAASAVAWTRAEGERGPDRGGEAPARAASPTAEPAPATATPAPRASATLVATATAATAPPTSAPPPRPTATLAPRLPITRLEIPSIHLRSEVVPARLVEQGGATTWEVPAFKAGHADFTAGAGAVGTAILLGHVQSLRSGNVFAELHKVGLGQPVRVWGGEQQFDYRVTAVRIVDRTDLSVLEPSETPTLSLITCIGRWLPLERAYAERLVVQAELEAGDAPR